MNTNSLLNRWLRPGARSRAANAEALHAGARFRHVTPRGTVEIARVLGVAADCFGIRHVSFNLSFRYHDKEVEAGERKLSTTGFLKRYAPLDDAAANAATGPGPNRRTEPTLKPPAGSPQS